MQSSNYGTMQKKIVFEDSDKRYADLKLKLRYDGLTQKQFFQALLSGYLSDDARIVEYVRDLKYEVAKQGKTKISKSYSLLQKAQNLKENFNLNEKQTKDIFDIIAQEFPDL